MGPVLVTRVATAAQQQLCFFSSRIFCPHRNVRCPQRGRQAHSCSTPARSLPPFPSPHFFHVSGSSWPSGSSYKKIILLLDVNQDFRLEEYLIFGSVRALHLKRIEKLIHFSALALSSGDVWMVPFSFFTMSSKFNHVNGTCVSRR